MQILDGSILVFLEWLLLHLLELECLTVNHYLEERNKNAQPEIKQSFKGKAHRRYCNSNKNKMVR